MDPASLLVSVRRRRGLTQAEVARRAGTSQPVVSAYERGHRDPSYGTLRRLVAGAGEQLELSARLPGGDLPPAVGDRGHAARLIDVLTLVDAVPARRRPRLLQAPRLVSRR